LVLSSYLVILMRLYKTQPT